MENLVPVVVSEVNDDGDEHWESSVLVGLENVQEVVVLEEAHGTVSNLKVIAADGADNTLEKAWNEVLNLLNFADFEDLLQFSEEEGLFDTVGKWPVFQQAFEKGNCQGAILG